MYRQVHGMAMVSPVLVVVANFVMEDTEERTLSTFHSPHCFWERYDGDTYAALHSDPIDPLNIYSHLQVQFQNLLYIIGLVKFEVSDFLLD